MSVQANYGSNGDFSKEWALKDLEYNLNKFSPIMGGNRSKSVPMTRHKREVIQDLFKMKVNSEKQSSKENAPRNKISLKRRRAEYEKLA